MKKQTNMPEIAKANAGFAILDSPIAHERMTVISELRLSLLIVITIENNTPIGIERTRIEGNFKTTMSIAILKGIPYIEICLIKEVKVSEANTIDVKITIPIKNTSRSCFEIYLSSVFTAFIYVPLFHFLCLYDKIKKEFCTHRRLIIYVKSSRDNGYEF